MDLHGVRDVVRPAVDADIPVWQPGDAYVAGGTWLFSERQPGITRLIDLSGLPWVPVTGGWESSEAPGSSEPGQPAVRSLYISGTCTYRDLERLPGMPGASAGGSGVSEPASGDPMRSRGQLGSLGPLLSAAIRSLSSSFKTWEVATVGGNLCLAYAKSMMAPVMLAADATYRLVTPGSGNERQVSAASFQIGVCETIRQPGEYLREVTIPAEALCDHYALERLSYTPTSHATGLVIVRRPAAVEGLATGGTLADPQETASERLSPRATVPASGPRSSARLVISAATAYPLARDLPDTSTEAELRTAVRELLDSAPLLSDAHGGAAYRRSVLADLAVRAWERAGDPRDSATEDRDE